MKDMTKLNLGSALIIGVIIILAAGNFPGTGATYGIIVHQDEKPVYDLRIDITNLHANGPFAVGTTDGTGSYIRSGGLFWIPSNFLYSFTVNGTTYAFQGPNNAVITVNIQ